MTLTPEEARKHRPSLYRDDKAYWCEECDDSWFNTHAATNKNRNSISEEDLPYISGWSDHDETILEKRPEMLNPGNEEALVRELVSLSTHIKRVLISAESIFGKYLNNKIAVQVFCNTQLSEGEKKIILDKMGITLKNV